MATTTLYYLTSFYPSFYTELTWTVSSVEHTILVLLFTVVSPVPSVVPEQGRCYWKREVGESMKDDERSPGQWPPQ